MVVAVLPTRAVPGITGATWARRDQQSHDGQKSELSTSYIVIHTPIGITFRQTTYHSVLSRWISHLTRVAKTQPYPKATPVPSDASGSPKF